MVEAAAELIDCGLEMAMRNRGSAGAMAVPMMMAEMTLASWETIFRRTMMMAGGSCSASEYQKMLLEKMGAAQASTTAMMLTGSVNAALSPWHRASVANVKRLRRRKPSRAA